MNIIGIAVFGALGGVVRLMLGHSPSAALGINVLGAIMFGLVVRSTISRQRSHWLADAISIGFVGSLTTFASFIVDALQMMHSRPVLALLYIVGMMVGGIGGCVFGNWCATPLRISRSTLSTHQSNGGDKSSGERSSDLDKTGST